MRRTTRTVVTILAALVAVITLGATVVAANGGDSSSVTRARLEKSLPATFANTYIQQARLLGRTDITAASLDPQAMCDKHGAENKDVGPGGDWVCLMSWTDPEVPMPPEGYGKFELNVHSNDCYTAAGPTKLTGFLTVTDTSGQEVTNPLFEFDSCFDPHGADTPTGIVFPSVLNVTSTAVILDQSGQASVQATCGTGEKGCAGSVVVTSGTTNLGAIPFALQEETTGTLTIPESVPTGAKDVTFTVTATTGFGPTSPVTLPVQGS